MQCNFYRAQFISTKRGYRHFYWDFFYACTELPIFILFLVIFRSGNCTCCACVWASNFIKNLNWSSHIFSLDHDDRKWWSPFYWTEVMIYCSMHFFVSFFFKSVTFFLLSSAFLPVHCFVVCDLETIYFVIFNDVGSSSLSSSLKCFVYGKTTQIQGFKGKIERKQWSTYL